MKSDARPRPSVLVVDDEHAIADLFVAWLEDNYRARAVYSGEAALEELHDGIDVVILDRHMPDISGDAVLATLRDWGLDCRVVMATGVPPDFDILHQGFDDYLTKPIGREELLGTVERLVEISSYDALHIHLSSLRVRRNVLQHEKSETELANVDRFQALEERIATLEANVAERRRAIERGESTDTATAND